MPVESDPRLSALRERLLPPAVADAAKAEPVAVFAELDGRDVSDSVDLSGASFEIDQSEDTTFGLTIVGGDAALDRSMVDAAAACGTGGLTEEPANGAGSDSLFIRCSTWL